MSESPNRSTYIRHLARGVVYLLLGLVLALLVAAASFLYYAPFLAWFGMIYLIAGVVSVASLGAIAERRSNRYPRLAAVLWFSVEAVVGVGLTGLYAATVVPLYSGTTVSQLVGIQVSNSIVCLIGAVLVAATWNIVAAARARRKSL